MFRVLEATLSITYKKKQTYCLWFLRTACKELCEEYLVVAGHVVVNDGGERLVHH